MRETGCRGGGETDGVDDGRRPVRRRAGCRRSPRSPRSPRVRERRRRELGHAVALLLLGGLVGGLGSPVAATAQTLDAAQAESLVRARWFEGLPEEEALRIGPEGARRLIEMLADPAESRSHANILLALGLCGQPGAFAAIAGWADRPREGEIDRDRFRAWQALPFALGHLARHDPRALARLEDRLRAGRAPTWHFRHHRGARLIRESRRAAATSLALTGLSEALGILDRAGRNVSDPDLEAHLQSVRALHARRALERGSDRRSDPAR